MNWDLWKETGMALQLSRYHEKLSSLSLLEDTGFDAQENIQILWKVLSCQIPQCIVCNEAIPERIEKYKKLASLLVSNTLDLDHSDFTPIKGDKAFRSDICQEMIRIFATYLGSDKIEADSDFFSYGGDSLLAIQLASFIEKKFSIVVHPHHIQQFSTPKQLAHYILGQHATVLTHSPQLKLPFSLVNLKEGDARRCVFLVHPVGGTFYIYRDFIKGLPHFVTVYGIQAQNIEKGEEVNTAIEEMASHYITLIKQVQPEGPYCVGGFSFGGVVAYEMAEQLSKANSAVDMVLMIDSPHYTTLPRKFKDNADVMAYLLCLGANYRIEPEALRKLTPKEQIDLFLRHGSRIKKALPHHDLPIMERFFALFRSNAEAMLHYKADHYSGDFHVLFFKASERDAINPDFPEKGWQVLLKDKISVYNTSGNHMSMMFDPYVQEISVIFSKLLEQRVLAEV